MPIVEHYTFLGHVGLVAKLGSFSPDKHCSAMLPTRISLSSDVRTNCFPAMRLGSLSARTNRFLAETHRQRHHCAPLAR